MRKMIARAMLRAMGRRYDYDTTYMQAMLDHAPNAFFKFANIMGPARHREIVPLDPYFAAKLVGAMAEDCGPCTQLVVNMATEAGVPGQQIQAVIERNTKAMSPDVATAFRFADAIAHRNDDEDARSAVRAKWGEKGVVELSLALQIGRIFPMVKLAMGYAKECVRVSVDGRDVAVVKRAA